MEDGKNWHERLEKTRELWSNHVRAWQASGLSQAAYCRQQQIRSRKFLYWKKRILGKPTPATLPAFAELSLGKVFDRPERSSLGPITLEIRPGYLIEIEKGFDPQTLLELIRVLDSACSG